MHVCMCVKVQDEGGDGKAFALDTKSSESNAAEITSLSLLPFFRSPSTFAAPLFGQKGAKEHSNNNRVQNAA